MLKVISSFCRMCLLCSVHQTLSSETSCVQCLSHKFSRRLIIVVFLVESGVINSQGRSAP